MGKIKEGDIILVQGGSWIARQIQKWMNIYRRKRGLDQRKLYNHVAVVVDLYGTLYVAEAVAKGIHVIPNARKYVDNNDVKLMEWVTPLSKLEGSVFSKEAIKYALEPHRYDFLNFWYQMKYILTGRWSGPTFEKSKKRIYCSELAAIVMDKVRGSFKGRTWDKNPLDIELCKDLKALE